MADKCSCRKSLQKFLDTRLFKALGDPTRVGLLARLAERRQPLTVKETASCCPIDLSVVSRHLSILRDAGILGSLKEGREVRYFVRYPELTKMLRGLADAIEACCPFDSCQTKEKENVGKK